MSATEFALVRFRDVLGAETAFTRARDRSTHEAPWMRQVGLVEHHHNGHWVLRGTFAGHYLDVDEALHVSGRGTAEGFAGGAVLGALLGPPGLAAGMVLGAMIGSQIGRPSEVDSEPHAFAAQLQTSVASAGSAIALIGDANDVDEMLGAIGEGEHVVRQKLTPHQADTLQAWLKSTPPASPGPSARGEEAVDRSGQVSTTQAP